jgi:hypothetical protein
MDLSHHAPRFNAALRLLAMFEVWIGTIAVLFGAFLVFMWLTGKATDRHGMLFVLFVALYLLPLGVTLVVAGKVLKSRHRARWLTQLLPVLWTVGFGSYFFS